MAKFEKGQPKIGGRLPGTPNKSTLVDRDFITALLDRQAEKIEKELTALTGKEYLSAIQTFLEYRMPKLQRLVIKEEKEKETHTIIIRGHNGKSYCNGKVFDTPPGCDDD